MEHGAALAPRPAAAPGARIPNDSVVQRAQATHFELGSVQTPLLE